jgi:capsular polysaccharide biosynthesis protein
MAQLSPLRMATDRAVRLKRRLLRQPSELESAAVAREVIDPGKTVTGRKGLCLPGQLDRVTNVPFGMSVSRELDEFANATRHIGASVRYEFRDVAIDGYRLATAQRVKIYRDDPAFGLADVPMIMLDEAALRTSYVAVHFFGHWLRDDCATQLLAEDYGPVLAMQTPAWPDKQAYRALLGRDYVEASRARVGRLHMFDDISQTDHKVARFRQSRGHFAAVAPKRAALGTVFLARGAGGTARDLVNQDALIEVMTARGIEVLHAENASVATIVAALQGARILISVEGSQISHGLLTLADKAGILVLQPPDRFFNSHMDWSHALDMHYAVVVGTPQPGGFSIAEDELLATLDLLDRTIG